ncbi:conserved unknown protein [Ectocarpus siliculosus]|uniref:Folate/biopterin transporter n=1 Tax=Ectocarpus siliculosus TaxID=2880 RepID=D8LTJ0_ECTSI|nr:conserved unknown protein [Ectocarpus siliculosus]|eukprot:CBN78031.1 conserved unknown protein [Ectocarpus siliculosus]
MPFSRPITLQGIELTWDVVAILVVYFVQGALGLARLATTFFFKDELHLAPAEVAALSGLFTLPWVFKPLYGFLSDGLPVFGYRRRSYMVLAGLLGASGWFCLANFAETPFQATAASIVASLGVAVSDVVADSIVVEKARDSDSQAVAGGLQSLCWGSAAVGGITSAYFSGSLLETMTTREVFSLTTYLPLLITVCAIFIDEKRLTENMSSPKQIVSEQASALWSAIKNKSVWLPALFIFLWRATPSSDSAYFFFLTNDIGVGPEFLGRVRLGSSIASLVGVWIFQSFLKETKISKVLFWTAVAAVPLGFTQLLLVYHINRDLGIPDELFTFGDDVVLTVLGQIAFMPTLVLSARLCPPGVEGTLFALLMSIFNGGAIVGSELGAYLTRVMGVTEADFRNLGMLIAICNVSSLLPLPFLKWIDSVEDDEKDTDANTPGKRK